MFVCMFYDLGPFTFGWRRSTYISWMWCHKGRDYSNEYITFKINGERFFLLSLLHILFPSILPATKYLFDKYLASISDQFETHFYFESCKEYICKKHTMVTKCPHCGLLFSAASNRRNGSFMIYLPLSSSLKDVLEGLQKNSQQLINKDKWVWDDTIGNIFDGKVMRGPIQNNTFGQWEGFNFIVELWRNSSLWVIAVFSLAISANYQWVATYPVVITLVWKVKASHSDICKAIYRRKGSF